MSTQTSTSISASRLAGLIAAGAELQILDEDRRPRLGAA